MNLAAFVIELIDDYRIHDYGDIDGGDLHKLLIKHGVMIERPATAEEAKQDWCLDWDIEEGDTVTVHSEEFAALKRSQA